MKELYFFRCLFDNFGGFSLAVAAGVYASMAVCRGNQPELFALFFGLMVFALCNVMCYLITEVIVRILRREKRREKKMASFEKKSTPAS